MKTLTAAIAGIMAGDLDCLTDVLTASDRARSEAAAKLPRPVVSRSSLTKVLEDWRKGLISAQDVQGWASFVRRGYVSGGASGAKRPISIEYDDQDETLIADTIGRLDEIGDQIDGQIGARELEEMLERLRQ